MINKLLELIKIIIQYLHFCKKTKIEKQHIVEKQQFDKKIDDVIDNGTLEDLLDLRKE